MLKNILLVGLGGALGSILRYLTTLLGQAAHWSSWIATLGVNTIGSFLIGIFMSACTNSDWKLMLVVGLCGGFTTYSTFSSQSFEMLRSGNYLGGGAYIIGTLILCLVSVWAGLYVGSEAAA